MLKIHNVDYYNEHIKPLLKKVEIFNIDLYDGFDMTDIRRKAEEHVYKNQSEFIADLSKVIRFIEDGDGSYIQKVYDAKLNTNTIKFINDSAMTTSLKKIKLWKDGKKVINGYDALLNSLSQLTIKGVRFNSDDETMFSMFQGYKYHINETYDESIIKPYLDFIKEVIANNNDDINEYVNNWISYIIQNPGKKTETALVLKGLQGIGKGTFTDVLCEILSRYSAFNITDISELTGQFNSVVEGKMLIILNELKNAGEDRMANFDALKSIITDRYIRINEKNQPRRDAENVANFIFCTNNAYPVKIERGDRRYVVLEVNGSKKNDFDYWNKLYASFKADGFYENLITYFARRDISKFNTRIIPMTEAKEDLIEASRSPVEKWICDNYDELCEGIACENVIPPSDMKTRTFQLQLKNYCERKKKQVNKVRSWYYFLKAECKPLFKQTINENAAEFVEDDEQQ